MPSAWGWSASPCMRYGIDDMRLLYENDVRFLQTILNKGVYRTMKIPMNWLKELCRTLTSHSPGILPTRMTMSGCKVEDLTSARPTDIKNVVVGQNCWRSSTHPDSDHMVSVPGRRRRSDAPVQIVTGAQQPEGGRPCARRHCTVPRCPAARRSKRASCAAWNRTACSARLSELGLTAHDFPNAVEDGILVLDEECARWAQTTAKALGMDDTCAWILRSRSNRPDCF